MENKHPGLYIQQELTKRGRTQKDFAHILGKKVSEVNELIKGKRNITIQRDILLRAIFDTPARKRITLQMEYDYVTSSQLFDEQKIEDIRSRKNILKVEKLNGGKVERLDDRENIVPSVDEEIDDKILPNTVAMPEESSTIQDRKIPQNSPKDRHREHEIFRNF